MCWMSDCLNSLRSYTRDEWFRGSAIGGERLGPSTFRFQTVYRIGDLIVGVCRWSGKDRVGNHHPNDCVVYLARSETPETPDESPLVFRMLWNVAINEELLREKKDLAFFRSKMIRKYDMFTLEEALTDAHTKAEEIIGLDQEMQKRIDHKVEEMKLRSAAIAEIEAELEGDILLPKSA